MKNLKVVKVNAESIQFDDGTTLSSYHDSDCCESHYLSFGDVTLADFEDMQFDLSNDNFFNRVEGYGIELIPVTGHPVRIPGYGSNNGFYSSQLDLLLTSAEGKVRTFDVSECQDISD